MAAVLKITLGEQEFTLPSLSNADGARFTEWARTRRALDGSMDLDVLADTAPAQLLRFFPELRPHERLVRFGTTVEELAVAIIAVLRNYADGD